MDEAQWAKAVARCHTALPPLLPGKLCELPRCFRKGGRKAGISPPGIVLSADVTEKKDSPQLCVREKISRNLKAYVMKLEKELF